MPKRKNTCIVLAEDCAGLGPLHESCKLPAFLFKAYVWDDCMGSYFWKHWTHFKIIQDIDWWQPSQPRLANVNARYLYVSESDPKLLQRLVKICKPKFVSKDATKSQKVKLRGNLVLRHWPTMLACKTPVVSSGPFFLPLTWPIEAKGESAYTCLVLDALVNLTAVWARNWAIRIRVPRFFKKILGRQNSFHWLWVQARPMLDNVTNKSVGGSK